MIAQNNPVGVGPLAQNIGNFKLHDKDSKLPFIVIFPEICVLLLQHGQELRLLQQDQ